MNAVEIEEAVSLLAAKAFDADSFAYEFLEAFGNKETTIKRLKAGATNGSDIGGVLQRNNVHIATCELGAVGATMQKLRESPATHKAKAKFIVATDGVDFEAEDLVSFDAPIACDFADFADHFGYFLALAGIATVQQIRENAVDIKATGRLNRLYVQLLKDNPEWGASERRHDMNHFMARLIFCFFAEDTDIFVGKSLFTSTIMQMSAADSANTHEVMGEIFRAMDTKISDRASANLPRWADAFPYVNGGLFAGATTTPRFTKIARSYLINIGNLDWTKINPDIFGSMIQAVTDEEERSALGLHYTSVPNILKVLNPLFLDELRACLAAAEQSPLKLLNLRKRLARIRVFDPACGSGNFLVIAYKELRAIEAEINQRRGESHLKSAISLTNFRGIELRDFSVEVARLALVIAEFQCDVLYLGQKEALARVLPLDDANWIVHANALRVDWLSACPPTGTEVSIKSDDLLATNSNSEIDFANEGGETYICGNPPYLGSTWQSAEQKADLGSVLSAYCKSWRSLDYVAGWFFKAALYAQHTPTSIAFVSTNSICQGQQVPIIWQPILNMGLQINFAYNSFKWANLASFNAGVMVVIVGFTNILPCPKRLFILENHEHLERTVANINPYLIAADNVIIAKRSKPFGGLTEMKFGNKPVDGGNLLLTYSEAQAASNKHSVPKHFIRPIVGSAEFIRGVQRYCIWVEDAEYSAAQQIPYLKARIDKVAAMRRASPKTATKELAAVPYKFGEVRQGREEDTIVIPAVSSENREYLPVGLLAKNIVVSNSAFALFDAPLWNLALLASRLHLVWVLNICGKLGMSLRYSNTLGWNTFPVPLLTEQNIIDLNRGAWEILLAREAHFPASIADLYDPKHMPTNLRQAHLANDEVVERIYIGRRFKNDSERLEKLFALYSKSCL